MKFDDALHEILSRVSAVQSELVPLNRAHRRALACDVFAAVPLPAFDNSAMDGYAVRSSDTGCGVRLKVCGESAAGRPCAGAVTSGTAIRIFMGATLPQGADAVVPHEQVRRHGDTIELLHTVASGSQCCLAGSDLAQGDLALPGGCLLDPGRLALLGALGVSQVPVARRPRVLLMATGPEVVTAGSPLEHGQIWDANSVALCALATEAGAEVTAIPPSGDDAPRIAQALEAACVEHQPDFVVTTGGICDGGYDAVEGALTQLEVETVFRRLAIHPGKPVRFGRRGAVLFFGLPDNPLAAQTTFEVLVRPALRVFQGLGAARLRVPARLTTSFSKRREITCFTRGDLGIGRTGFVVTPADGHRSGVLGSNVKAGALMNIPDDTEQLEAGATVMVDILRPDAVPAPRPRVPVVAVCASGSDSGKTLWVCALIAALSRRGLRVGSVKHTHRDFDIPGKDSSRHRDAGARRVILSASNGRSVLIPEAETILEDLVCAELGDMDIVLAEGFRSAGPEVPKLFVGSAQDSARCQNVVGLLRRANAPIDVQEADAAAQLLDAWLR